MSKCTTAWRQPMTIQEINTDIDARWPSLINFNLRAQLEELTKGRMYFTTFAPKWQITDLCLKAGLIKWAGDKRNVTLTDEGRAALEQS